MMYRVSQFHKSSEFGSNPPSNNRLYLFIGLNEGSLIASFAALAKSQGRWNKLSTEGIARTWRVFKMRGI